MTSLNPQLWELIQKHDMPSDAAGKSFIHQLRRDHHISQETAQTAIAEYRKFMYLCATRTARNVPSKAVDLVWHLHMQHSRDYWDLFCKKLGKPVHHSPGAPLTDHAKHLADYQATIDAYKDLFGTPPRGIWRQNNRTGIFVCMLMVVAFAALTAAQNGITLLGGLSVGLILVVIACAMPGVLPRHEFTFIFDPNDPFADNAAGDCGSGGDGDGGDGGGCGD